MSKKVIKLFLSAFILLTGIYIFTMFKGTTTQAETPLITTVEEFTTAYANAKDGDTLLVGDITFQPMPQGMIQLLKNITVKSGKNSNAIFTNATFVLYGTTSDSEPLSVKFENIDFRGDKSSDQIDSTNESLVSASLPDIMKTMTAMKFTKNVFASYEKCTFEGYHYGYGGAFNAIYSTATEQQNNLRLDLNDCIFRNNAGKYGGCMYLLGYDNNVHLNAKHCKFEENFATTGGAIWSENATLDLLDCIFTKNTPMQTEIASPNGGALALMNCNVELNGCLISENRSLGKGAGIFCEAYPFKSFVVENCSFLGNSSLSDENIFVEVAPTNYDTVPKIRLYFSSIFGKVGFINENAETFGCLYVIDTSEEETPTTANGYNLCVPPSKLQESETITPSKHYVLPSGSYSIPTEELDKVAGGKFRNSFGKLQVGDNYVSEITLTVERSSKNKETVTLRYGDELILDAPERNGYAFDGWKKLNGTLFMGGELTTEKIVAKWDFVLSENLYVIWVPVVVVVSVLVIAIVIKKRKTPIGQTEVAVSEPMPSDCIVKVWFTEDEISSILSSASNVQTLTRRETEVFKEILEGKKQKEIAYDLGIEITTVKDFYRKIYDKLDVKSREELLKSCSKIVSQ